MKPQEKKPQAPEPAATLAIDAKFSGVIHTLVRKPHNGFANFAVATMTIEAGVIKRIELSDPYVGFEALHKLELKNENLLAGLRKNYPSIDGQAPRFL